MSKNDLSEFAQRERTYIDARCAQPFKSIVAPQTEYDLFEARMRAIDALDKLYDEIEQDLAEMRSTLDLLEQSSLRSPTAEEAAVEIPLLHAEAA